MQNTNRLFPEQLLVKCKQEKEKYFRDYTISHPKLIKVFREILFSIGNSNESQIIMVIGPSGVGKSKVFEKIIEKIFLESEEEMKSDMCIIPIAGIELPNPDTSNFNWKDFYYRLLKALHEPLIDHKVDFSKLLKQETSKRKISPFHPGTAPELRRSLENAIKYRRPKALLIDEAQHFFKTATGKGLQSQFDSLKSLANMSHVQLVLLGTYELNEIININGQLARRVKEIHFPRYDISIQEDYEAFGNIVHTFQKYIPLEIEPDLIGDLEFIYEFSLGCVGILKKWLQRSLSDALENNQKTITIEVLKRNRLSANKILTLAEEALNGELDFLDNEEQYKKIKELLGTYKETSPKSTDKRKNKKTGTRNPSRDNVGAPKEA
ncbi:AAA family ATPase [Mesobacillus jeotgali]|uniref:AAA family ATPase n=1 Tax=Mesobacillus jeotgali TaxID=129985 RepID=UPI0009A80C26|nr:ATP-binding protein [Mesobacillus jeotgali]